MSGEKIHVEFNHTPNRCPYCHVDVRYVEENWVACGACLARHHEACWREINRCSTCGAHVPAAPVVLTPLQAARPAPPARTGFWQFATPMVIAAILLVLSYPPAAVVVGPVLGTMLALLVLRALWRALGGTG